MLVLLGLPAAPSSMYIQTETGNLEASGSEGDDAQTQKSGLRDNHAKAALLCSSTPLSNMGHGTSGLTPEPDSGVVNNQCLPFFLDASRKTKQI